MSFETSFPAEPGQPDLRITAQGPDAAGVSVVAVAGELDMATAERFVTTLGEQLARGPVELDLGTLAFMDSSGVRALDTLLRDVEGRGWALTVRPQLGEAVRQVLELTGMLGRLPMAGGGR